MTNREFVAWLIGFLELCEPQIISRKMLFVIKNHLNLVLAVEKEFGQINQKIYNKISKLLEEEQVDAELFYWLRELLADQM